MALWRFLARSSTTTPAARRAVDVFKIPRLSRTSFETSIGKVNSAVTKQDEAGSCRGAITNVMKGHIKIERKKNKKKHSFGSMTNKYIVYIWVCKQLLRSAASFMWVFIRFKEYSWRLLASPIRREISQEKNEWKW